MSDEYEDPRLEGYRSQYHDAVRDRDAMRELIASDGWNVLAEALGDELNRLRKEYEKSGPITEGNIYVNEYRRAQMNMLHTLLDWPQQMLDGAEEACTALRTVLNAKPNDGDIDGTEAFEED